MFKNNNRSHYNTKNRRSNPQSPDRGPEPFVLNIQRATSQNRAFRQVLWTGAHMQLVLMSIPANGDIGLEVHPDTDQFICIEDGQGIVKMGNCRDNLSFKQPVFKDFAFVIPKGTWHNLINTGNKPIKLFTLYAPPEHPKGTLQMLKPRR